MRPEEKEHNMTSEERIAYLQALSRGEVSDSSDSDDDSSSDSEESDSDDDDDSESNQHHVVQGVLTTSDVMNSSIVPPPELAAISTSHLAMLNFDWEVRTPLPYITITSITS